MNPEPLFLTDQAAARRRFHDVVGQLATAVTRWGCEPGPRHPVDPATLAAAIDRLDPCPAQGRDLDDVLDEVGPLVLGHGVRPSDPGCAAHLHSPTLLTAAATELAIGATNQSLDSFDQAPAATLVEDHLMRWLARQLGLPAGSTGVLTAGGTASNLLGLLLARDRAGDRASDRASDRSGDRTAVARHGLPPESSRWRIVCSRAAHFSVQRAVAVLGLGHDAVVTVPTDDHDQLDLGAWDRTLADQVGTGRVVAVVATAGTTDAGAIDPLAELANRARAVGAWFHVDAAVGGALCLSDALGHRLDGIARADSVTVDLHKLWWQPIGASALLVADPETFAAVRHPSDYLDRPEDDDHGQLNLVGRSLDTSRRFDALKILVSLRATGRRQMGAMVEHVLATAAETGRTVARHPELELLCPVSTVMVLFRWRPSLPALPEPLLDQINTHIQRELFATGRAVIGRTRTRRGQQALKLTVVNPTTTVADLAQVAGLVVATGRAALAEIPTPEVEEVEEVEPV